MTIFDRWDSDQFRVGFPPEKKPEQPSLIETLGKAIQAQPGSNLTVPVTEESAQSIRVQAEQANNFDLD